MKVILAARINCAPFGITSVFKHHLIRRIHHTADTREASRCDRAFMGSQGLHLRACLCRERLVRFCGQLCVCVDHPCVLCFSVANSLCVCGWTGSSGCWVRISTASFSLCFFSMASCCRSQPRLRICTALTLSPISISCRLWPLAPLGSLPLCCVVCNIYINPQSKLSS